MQQERCPENEIISTLVTLLICHFGRIPVWEGSKDNRLLPLQPEIELEISNLEKLTLNIYSNYLRNLCQTQPKTKDNFLPFSKRSFPSHPDTSSFNLTDTFLQPISTYPQQPGISSFYGLSGNTNNFKTLPILLEQMNHTIGLDASVVPVIDLSPENLSASILDYFKIGNLNLLSKRYKFRNINEFTRTFNLFTKDLKKIKTQLEENQYPNDNDSFLYYLTIICDRLNVMKYGQRKRRSWIPFARKRTLAKDNDLEDKYFDKVSVRSTKFGRRPPKDEQ